MFHSQTTLILSALLFLALPVMVMLVLRPASQPAVAWWCAAGAMAGSGILLFWLRPHLPPVVSFHLANTLVLGSLLMWSQSLRMTLGRPWSRRALILLLGLCVAFYSVLFEWATPSVRGLCVRLALGLLSFVTAYWAWRLFHRTRSANAAAIACNYLLLGAMLVGQAGLTASSISEPSPFSNTWDASLLALTALTTALIGHYCYVGMMLDLAAQERIRSEQAEKGAIQTQFIGAKLQSMDRRKRMAIRSGSLAHELNQPLTAALLNAQMAHRHGSTPSAGAPLLLNLLAQVDSAIDRTTQILNRIRTDHEAIKQAMQPLDLRHVLDQSLELIEPERLQCNVSLAVTHCARPLDCLGDPLALSQVFFNLLRNAVQAMAHQPVRQLTIECKVEARDVVVVVRDTGPGLAADLHQLAGPLMSTKEDGLGMGLAISRDIVMQHKGSLSLRGLTQGGVEATVILPLHEVSS